MAEDTNQRPIIIKKIKKGGGGHHGGAWKVAYADFVTAMMAFFLLLWLLSSTSEEQKQGLAEYFTYAQVSSNSGGNGMLGGTSLNMQEGVSDGTPSVSFQLSPPTPPQLDSDEIDEESDFGGTAPSELAEYDSQQTTETVSDDAINKAISERERRIFEDAERQLKQAISEIDELSQLSGQLIIDHTPEGMRIQLVDQQERPMFRPGTAEPLARTRAMFREISKVVNRLPNRISISGHTDAAPFQRADGYGNWELSVDRATVSRRILRESGVPNERFSEVTGKADTEPLFPDDPYISGNRRISITLLREVPALSPIFGR